MTDDRGADQRSPAWPPARRVVRFPTDQARPAPSDVLVAQGLPHEDALPSRLRLLLDDALGLFEGRVEPRAIFEEIPGSRLGELIDGLQYQPDETAIGNVARRARHAAVFVATLGEPLCRAVKELFDGGELAEAWMLDAVCSSGADLLADRLAADFEQELHARGRTDERVLPYSPGYCGWGVAGQRRLFAALEPGTIGVTLNESCLMSPIKSVSGVLLAGPGEIHRFRPVFEFCRDCRTHACGRRMASVIRS